ncbi:nuclear receptor subfamily 1 group I member 2 isoform X1 [Cottoperca gobio]|uniref:Nuclear receptor subfamily 1 group I member 2 isoform X1 n=1 Tax=Cottoperca gobio TaxID=56716 RepID=A0A6J2RYT7_COTGO|nr:nuclear receptor subfamily 1 group I member 2 isoform X1 [Cottoperca gobio]
MNEPTGVQSIREALSRHNEEEEDEDEDGKVSEDEEPRACGVCGDLAKGYHFNALTCEGCKGFFRRAIKRSTQLRCRFLNRCNITKNNRRSCQACRFTKCQAIGMRQEMVMSEKEVLERRIRIQTRKMLDAPVALSSQHQKTIQELLCGHRQSFDSAFYRFSGFRPMDRNVLPANEYNESESSFSPSLLSLSGSFEKQENQEDEEARKGSVFTALPHVADLTTYMIQDIITFSKSIRDFRSLSMEDQISLLKGATFEIMQIRFNMVFNAKTGIWECGHITYCIDDAVRDRPGVQQHRVIDELHENLALTLKSWIDCKRTGPEKHLLYPKVMACLTEMRTMTEEYSKQVLQIQDIQPDIISPLIMEMVSKNPCNNLY